MNKQILSATEAMGKRIVDQQTRQITSQQAVLSRPAAIGQAGQFKHTMAGPRAGMDLLRANIQAKPNLITSDARVGLMPIRGTEFQRTGTKWF